jgi:hypothetical protein
MHDQTTYIGRLQHFSELTDPRNLLATDAQLNRAKLIVDSGNLDHPDYTKSKKLVDSTFHPDTGNKILLPFRMAAFVPTNVPIIAFMLMPNLSVVSL